MRRSPIEESREEPSGAVAGGVDHAAARGVERHRIREKSTGHPSEEPPPTKVDSADPLAGAVGATPITLVHDSVCGISGAELPAGSEALMVLFEDPRRKLITGRNALPQASTPNEEKADD